MVFEHLIPYISLDITAVQAIWFGFLTTALFLCCRNLLDSKKLNPTWVDVSSL